jgi:hypothetical protein
VHAEFQRNGIDGTTKGTFTRVMTVAEIRLLGDMFNGTATGGRIAPLVPIFWKIVSSGDVRPHQLTYLGDAYLHLARCGATRWFQLSAQAPPAAGGDECSPNVVSNVGPQVHGPAFYIISSASIFGASSSSYGVMAIYLGAVLTVGRLLRMGLVGLGFKIQLEDMGDRIEFIVKLVGYIYESRMHISMEEDGEWDGKPDLPLEESLYEALINMLRIPEFLMRETGFYKHAFPVGKELNEKALLSLRQQEGTPRASPPVGRRSSRGDQGSPGAGGRGRTG